MSGNRTFAIGDIHGEVKALKSLIRHIKPGRSDTIVFLGDIIDKGPQTAETIQFLIALSKRTNTVFVRGNHEEMALMALQGHTKMGKVWLKHGGRQTLDSYGADDLEDLKSKMPASHRRFLEKTVNAYLKDDFIFVHAGWHPGKKLADQTASTLRWNFINSAFPDRKSKKTIFCGHSSLVTGKPAKKGNIVCIDTIEYGWLTAMNIRSGQFIQIGKDGTVRKVAKPCIFSQKKHVPKQFWN